MAAVEDDNTWYRITLSQEQVEFGFFDILRAEIEEIWISRGGMEGFTVWQIERTDQTEIYFSPIAGAAVQILLYRFNGTSCPMPPLDALTFVLGHAFTP